MFVKGTFLLIQNVHDVQNKHIVLILSKRLCFIENEICEYKTHEINSYIRIRKLNFGNMFKILLKS